MNFRRCSPSASPVIAVAVFLVASALAAAVDGFSGRLPSSSHRANTNIMSAAKKQRLNNDDDGDVAPSAPRPIRAGFVGCGTIASAIAEGLASPDHAARLAEAAGLSVSSIRVTRRSEAKSTRLGKMFPGVVTVCESAREVVEGSDLVFLCLLPQQVDGVLDELREGGAWRKEEHTLVSLVSTSVVEDLIQKTGLHRSNVYKMICLPAIAKREGCALLQPAPAPSPPVPPSASGSVDVKAMLEALGGCVECANDDVMNTMMVTTAMMGPMYDVMRNNRDWLVKRGVSAEDASYFVGRSYLSMVQDAERGCRNPGRFDDLVEEQTPGGLNEQSLKNLEKQGVFESYDRAMDAVLSRLQGKSDGSLPSNGK